MKYLMVRDLTMRYGEDVPNPAEPASTPCRAHPTSTSSLAQPEDVAELLVTCVKRLRRLVDARLSQHGLSMSRCKVLGVLGQHGPSHQSELATIFDLAPRTVTELVDGLERDGLVLRSTDPVDRRARYVDLTPAGRDVLAKAMAARVEIVAEVFGSLGESQLAVLAATLRQLDDRVLEVAGPDGAVHHGRHPMSSTTPVNE